MPKMIFVLTCTQRWKLSRRGRNSR